MSDPISAAFIKMTVNCYGCKVCGKWHRRPSKKFFEHYEFTAKQIGMPPLPQPKTEATA